MPLWCTDVTPRRSSDSATRIASSSARARSGATRAASRSRIAPPRTRPVAVPERSRTMPFGAGSALVSSIPAAASACELARPAPPPLRTSQTGLRGAAASIHALDGRTPPHFRSSHPSPSTQLPGGAEAAASATTWASSLRLASKWRPRRRPAIHEVEDVEVRVDEPGQHGVALRVDDARGGPRHRADLVVRADEQDPVTGDRHGLRSRPQWIGGPDASVDDRERGLRGGGALAGLGPGPARGEPQGQHGERGASHRDTLRRRVSP